MFCCYAVLTQTLCETARLSSAPVGSVIFLFNCLVSAWNFHVTTCVVARGEQVLFSRTLGSFWVVESVILVRKHCQMWAGHKEGFLQCDFIWCPLLILADQFVFFILLCTCWMSCTAAYVSGYAYWWWLSIKLLCFSFLSARVRLFKCRGWTQSHCWGNSAESGKMPGNTAEECTRKGAQDLWRHSHPSGKAQETSRSSPLLPANENLMTIQGGRPLLISKN